MGSGRDTQNAGQLGHTPQQRPYGQQQPPYPGQGGGPQQWPQAGGPGHNAHTGHGEPEYFGGSPGTPHPGPGRDTRANNPGHTQSFSVQDPYGGGQHHGSHGPHGPHGPYGPHDPGGPHHGPDGGYNEGNMYAAGAGAPPVGPKLHWKELLPGVIFRPKATFWQMRDYAVWGPALICTFLYGLLAIFGLDEARAEVLGSTLSTAIPYVLSTAVAVVLVGLVLGAVTHTLARQFGGDGAWAPTIGLSMLIMSMTDAPRLFFALFLGGTAGLVQLLGWITWIAAAALFTTMVSRSHDLHWPKALGASAIQLLALLALIKLGTL